MSTTNLQRSVIALQLNKLLSHKIATTTEQGIPLVIVVSVIVVVNIGAMETFGSLLLPADKLRRTYLGV